MARLLFGSRQAIQDRLRSPKSFQSLGAVCSLHRCPWLLVSENLESFELANPGYSQSMSTPTTVRNCYFLERSCSPSAPVASIIFLTFSANNLRLFLVLAASEKPSVLPHPPIATCTCAPSAKFERTSSTDVNNGHSVWFGTLKTSDRMKARSTCVILATRDGSGMILCCLEIYRYVCFFQWAAFPLPCQIDDESWFGEWTLGKHVMLLSGGDKQTYHVKDNAQPTDQNCCHNVKPDCAYEEDRQQQKGC